MRNSAFGCRGWSAFLVGSLVGAGVALLLTPQRGSEIRRLLGRCAARLKEDLMEQGGDADNRPSEQGQENTEADRTDPKKTPSASQTRDATKEVARRSSEGGTTGPKGKEETG